MSAHGAKLMTALKLQWVFIAPWHQAHECSCTIMSTHEHQLTLKCTHKQLRATMNTHEQPWVLMRSHEQSWAWRHEARSTHKRSRVVMSGGRWSHGHSDLLDTLYNCISGPIHYIVQYPKSCPYLPLFFSSAVRGLFLFICCSWWSGLILSFQSEREGAIPLLYMLQGHPIQNAPPPSPRINLIWAVIVLWSKGNN